MVALDSLFRIFFYNQGENMLVLCATVKYISDMSRELSFYLLVLNLVVFVLDAKVTFELADFAALVKDQVLEHQGLPANLLAPRHHLVQTACTLHLHAEFPKLLDRLLVSASGLADGLALTATEAQVRIGLVPHHFLELELRGDDLAATLGSPVTPPWVHEGCECFDS